MCHERPANIYVSFYHSIHSSTREYPLASLHLTLLYTGNDNALAAAQRDLDFSGVLLYSSSCQYYCNVIVSPVSVDTPRLFHVGRKSVQRILLTIQGFILGMYLVSNRWLSGVRVRRSDAVSLKNRSTLFYECYALIDTIARMSSTGKMPPWPLLELPPLTHCLIHKSNPSSLKEGRKGFL